MEVPGSPRQPQKQDNAAPSNLAKKQRVMLLEESVENVMNVIMKEHSSDELCDMETFKAMIRDFDESWIADTLKKTKLAARNKGSHLGGTGRVEVVEFYSLPGMTKMARQMGMEEEIALDFTTTDENCDP